MYSFNNTCQKWEKSGRGLTAFRASHSATASSSLEPITAVADAFRISEALAIGAHQRSVQIGDVQRLLHEGAPLSV